MRPFVCFMVVCYGVSVNGTAQNVILNSAVDTVDVDNKAIVKLWSNYLKSNPDSLYNNPFWNTDEKQKYKSYDLLKSEGFISPSLYYWAKFNQNIILSISKKAEDRILKSMFYRQGENNEIIVMALINVVTSKANGQWLLHNYLPFYSQEWSNKSVGSFNYVFHPRHNFSLEKANAANAFLEKLKMTFSVEVSNVTYYIAENCDEIHRLKGFDYVFSMGTLDVCGFFDVSNKIIYSTSNDGENNQHEIIHVINEKFPNAHQLLLAGIASYWGGETANFGKPLEYHAKRIDEFLRNHKEIDLNLFTEFHTLDSKTNPQYVIGAIICDEALKKGGIELLKKMLNGGVTDEALVSVINEELQIAPTELNEFFRSRISQWARVQAINPIDMSTLQKN